ncbi:MAG: YraN family protein [Acidobacteria bacterium]|nr:YraN family protein [Acidobacteriota bacterium]
MKTVAQLWQGGWQRMVRRASLALLRRKTLTPEALVGRQGEEAAYWYLRRQGYVMVERNYHPPGLRSEIDLIGWDKNVLVFVEVKTRSDKALRQPEAAVDLEKRRNVTAAARAYRKRANQSATPFRFDVISITAAPAGMQIQHFRDAFQEELSSPHSF